MTELQQSNLARAAVTLLTRSADPENRASLHVPHHGEVTFDMGVLYATSLNPAKFVEATSSGQPSACGYSCCFGGLVALVVEDTRPNENWSNYLQRQTSLFGDADIGGRFLFSSKWPSDPGQTARRTLLSLTDPTFEPPDYFKGIERYLEDYSDRQVVEGLQKLVLL